MRRAADGAAATARMVWRCLPIDARRPASWLAAVSAGAACGWLARHGALAGAPPASALAIVAGAAAALAAVGDPPGATLRPRGDRRLLMAVTASRAVWPLAGTAVAALAGAPAPVALALGGAIGAAAATAVILRRSGADAAEAAGATLFASAAATAAVAACAEGGAPGLGLPAAVVGWAAVVLAAVSWSRGGGRPVEWTGAAAIEAIGWPAASGRLGGGLVAVSMIAALLGMAGWLFLAPDRAGWFGALALACFVALAVPRATLAWGAVNAGRRGVVLATTAGPPPGGHGFARRVDRMLGGGFLGPEWRGPASAAAILGWPPLVAAGVVGGPEAADRLGLVASLFAWAAALALGTSLVLRAGASRETALAVALAVALAACGLAAGRETPQNPRNDRRTGVEESGASCETPQPRRPPTGAGRPRPEPRQAASSAV